MDKLELIFHVHSVDTIVTAGAFKLRQYHAIKSNGQLKLHYFSNLLAVIIIRTKIRCLLIP